jgi:ornithine carbamoyltransferase
VDEGALDSLRGRSLLKDADLTGRQLFALIELAAELKAARRDGTEKPRLRNKYIALIFEKPSTRTRCAFEVAAESTGLDGLLPVLGVRRRATATTEKYYSK